MALETLDTFSHQPVIFTTLKSAPSFVFGAKFAAERYVWSSWTQKTLDRAVQGLSNGVQVVTHRLEMSRVIQVKLPCSEKCQHLDFAVERFILSSWTKKIETKAWRELSIDIKINKIQDEMNQIKGKDFVQLGTRGAWHWASSRRDV